MLQEADSQDGLAKEHCSNQTVSHTIVLLSSSGYWGQNQTACPASDFLVCADATSGASPEGGGQVSAVAPALPLAYASPYYWLFLRQLQKP